METLLAHDSSFINSPNTVIWRVRNIDNILQNICGWKQVRGKNFVIYRVVCLKKKKKSHRGMTAHLTMWGPCAVKTVSLFSIFNINCTISSHFWQFHKQNSVLLCLSKTLIIKFISQCWWFLVSLLWGSKSSNPVF